MSKHKDTNICDSWLQDEWFKKWLQKYSGNSNKAICTLCNKKVIDIRNMVISALLYSL